MTWSTVPLGSDPVIHVYSPYSETNDQGLASPIGGLWRNMKVAVNGEVDAASLTTSVRAAIAAVDPALADRERDDDERKWCATCRRRSASAPPC